MRDQTQLLLLICDVLADVQDIFGCHNGCGSHKNWRCPKRSLLLSSGKVVAEEKEMAFLRETGSDFPTGSKKCAFAVYQEFLEAMDSRRVAKRL